MLWLGYLEFRTLHLADLALLDLILDLAFTGPVALALIGAGSLFRCCFVCFFLGEPFP